MKKQSIIILLIAIIVLIAVFTNPNAQTHREAVKVVFNENLQKEQAKNALENNSEFEKAGANLGMMLGSVFIDKMIENIVTSDNYVLFSLTKVSWEGKSKIIGYGLFGNVFISDEANKALKNDSNEEALIQSKAEDKKDLEELE
mgnify:CR=1 FL=1